MASTAAGRDRVPPQAAQASQGHRPENDDEQVARQVEAAISLLDEARRKGVGVPDDVVAAIFAAHERKERNEGLGAAARFRFWNAYSVLQNILGPAMRTRRLFWRAFFATLLSLLLLQCYVTFGAVTLDKIQRLETELLTLTGTLSVFQAGAPIPAEVQARAARRLGDADAAKERLAQLGADRDAYYALASLINPWSIATLAGDPAPKPNGIVDRSLRVATLEPWLDFLAKYVLPALYGLLGACAYVLRQLFDEIGQLRFAHDRRVQYSLRLNIGLLGGLAIGWFVSPGDDASAVANLSPLALAFVAGYGSDLLFALLDRIVNAFATPRGGGTARTVEESAGGLERVKEVRTETRVAGGRAAEGERAVAPLGPRSATDEQPGQPAGHEAGRREVPTAA